MSEASRKDSQPNDALTRYSSCFFSDPLNKCRSSIFKYYNTISPTTFHFWSLSFVLNFVVIKPLSDTAYRWCRKFIFVKCHNVFKILRSGPVSVVRQIFFTTDRIYSRVLYQREIRVWSVRTCLPLRTEWLVGPLLGSYLLLHVDFGWF
jgi:hypothetical protein